MALIVWDRDDVLNDLMKVWLEQCWKPFHPECSVKYQDLTENPPHRVLGINLQDYLSSLDGFRLSERAANLTPIAEVLAWFKKYGAMHDHMVLSAIPAATAAPAASWTFHHFGSWVQSFHVVSARDNDHSSPHRIDKLAYLRWLGIGGILVEDSQSISESARLEGWRAVTIPRPWNSAPGAIGDALVELTRVGRMTSSS
jgi:hypothetical protein